VNWVTKSTKYGKFGHTEKKLMRGGNIPTTPFLGLQMREKASINEGMIDTTGKLANHGLQVCVS
jgi:hypothetical protein